MTPGEVRQRLREAFVSQLPPGRTLPDDVNFFEAGLTSRAMAAALAELGPTGSALALIDLFRYPTLRQLGTELVRRTGRPHDGAPGQPEVRGTVRPLPWRTGARDRDAR